MVRKDRELFLKKREVINMLFDQIAEVVAEHLDCEKDEITRESTFESLGIDSLDAVELVMELEEKLGIQLDLDRDLENIDELVKFVEEKTEG
jgi:acyl carrier protein